MNSIKLLAQPPVSVFGHSIEVTTCIETGGNINILLTHSSFMNLFPTKMY